MPNVGRPWTQAEDDYLREHYGRQRPAAIGAVIDRSRQAVMQRASVLGVAKPGRHWPPWSEAELAQLRRGYGVVPTRVLARQIGRTEMAVRREADRRGLNFERQWAQELTRSQATAARLRVLLACALGLLSPMDAAARLGIPPDQVRRLALTEAAAATDAAGKASQRHGEARKPLDTSAGMGRSLTEAYNAKVERSA